MKLKTMMKVVDMKTLFASFLPVIFGSAYSLYAFGKADPILMLVIAFALILIQSATNLFNDYKDFKRGADSEDKAQEKALVSGELSVTQLLTLVWVFTGTAILIGIIIASLTSWLILSVVAVGLFTAYFYSSGPKPIAYTCYGELVSGCVMGFGITATVIYIQAGEFHWQSILASIPTVIYIAYIMFTNNLCDRDKDLSIGRRTLPGTLSFETGRKIWLLFCLTMVVITILLVGIGVYPISAFLVLLMLLNYQWIMKIGHFEKDQFKKDKMMGIIGKLGIEYHLLMLVVLLIS